MKLGLPVWEEIRGCGFEISTAFVDRSGLVWSHAAQIETVARRPTLRRWANRQAFVQRTQQ